MKAPDMSNDVVSASEEAPAPAKEPRPAWIKWATRVVVFVLFAWVIRNIVRDAERIDWSELGSEPGPFVFSAFLWFVAFAFRAWLWGEMMRRTGYPIGHLAGARVFLASHLGRYLPGKMWSVLGAGIFGKQEGVPAAACALSMTVFLIIYYMLGSLAALLVIWQLSELHLWSAVIVGVLGIATLVFLGTRWFPLLLHWIGRKAKRNLADVQLPSPSVLVLVGVGLAAVWAVTGWALVQMTRGVLPPGSPPMSFIDGLGVYAASLVAGFLALFAPAGLGVREAVMTALLQPVYGGAFAAVISIVSRLTITVLELVLSFWGIWPHMMARRKQAATKA